MCLCAQSHSHVQLFATPWTVSHQAPLSMGFSQQEYWRGQPFPFPRDLDTTVIEIIPFSEQTYGCWGDGVVRDFGMDMSIQSLSRIRLFVIPWTAASQASLSITSSWSLLKLMSVESVMPSNHLILCRPLLLPPSICPSIRVFSN